MGLSVPFFITFGGAVKCVSPREFLHFNYLYAALDLAGGDCERVLKSCEKDAF